MITTPAIPAAVLLVAVTFSASVGHAQTYRAKKVEAVDGNVQCNWARDRLITIISGPCEDFSPPKRLMVGETFKANDETKTINLLLAHRAEKDMPIVGLKEGDWTCTAAESPQDIPTGQSDHTGTWLYIGKCRPIE